ncbi:MAG: O-acetyl-ADP-ribose deacetylase [Ignavibacteriaceae bacterium]
MESTLKNKLEVFRGDITKLNVDAIVNAANSSLLGGGGVDGAIHNAAGPELLEYCRKLNGCPTGEAKITPGFKLPAKYVIHTVGPIWHGGIQNEPKLLASCYKNSLNLAIENGIRTIAFPAISTGIYGYPLNDATKIAVNVTLEFLENNSLIEKVIFVCFDERTYENYNRIIEELLENYGLVQLMKENKGKETLDVKKAKEFYKKLDKSN